MNWISVKDRLPDDEEAVLIYWGFDFGKGLEGEEYYAIAQYICSEPKPYWSEHDKDTMVVTHWMPLPEPPEEGEEC